VLPDLSFLHLDSYKLLRGRGGKVAERPVLMKSSILLLGGNWSEDAGMSNINECLIIHTERERFLRAS
jgi:hypothetical protein